MLESGYARSALVSDVDLIEEYPASYATDISRRHRWVRGDWQLFSWLLPRVPSAAGKLLNPLSPLFQWKVLDNLRRSLVPIVLTTLLIASWLANNKNGEAQAAWLAVMTISLVLFLTPMLSLLINLFKNIT